jgi:hypothetical protein
MVSGGTDAFGRAPLGRTTPSHASPAAAREPSADDGRRGGRLPAASGVEEAGEEKLGAPAEGRRPLPPADSAAGEPQLPGLPAAGA